MPSAPKAPAPINVADTTAQSQQANLQTGQNQLSLNTIGQDTPYGSLSYTTSIDPITGLPKYQANTQLSPDQQAILNNLQGTQKTIGSTAGNLASNTSGMYSQAPDLIGGANSLTMQALNSQMPAWERFNAPARAQLDTQLRNSGITPDSNPSTNSAYQQQMDKLTQQQQLNEGQWLSNFEPQAFSQALQNYNTPLNTEGALFGMMQPADLKQSMVNTPQAQVAPTNVGQLATTSQQQAFQNYQQKVAQQNAMMGMFTGGIGAAAKLPTNTIGGQALTNMFAGGAEAGAGLPAGMDAMGMLLL